MRKILTYQEFVNKNRVDENTTKFVAFFGGKQIEIEAKDLLDAKNKAIEILKVPKSKRGYLAVSSLKAYDNKEFMLDHVENPEISEGFRDDANHEITEDQLVALKELKAVCQKILKQKKSNIEVLSFFRDSGIMLQFMLKDPAIQRNMLIDGEDLDKSTYTLLVKAIKESLKSNSIEYIQVITVTRDDFEATFQIIL